MPISSVEQYVATNGTRCPVCHSNNIETSDFAFDEAGMIVVDVQCNTCQSEWTDYYKLDKYKLDSIRGAWQEQIEQIRSR